MVLGPIIIHSCINLLISKMHNILAWLSGFLIKTIDCCVDNSEFMLILSISPGQTLFHPGTYRHQTQPV